MHIPVIMHIDDDVDDQEILRTELRKRSDLEVHSCDSTRAIECLGELQRKNRLPALIVLDINMPVINGKDIARIIRSNDHWKDIPIVVFSTAPTIQDKLYFDQLHIVVLSKPFQLSRYDDVISNMLNIMMQPSPASKEQKLQDSSR